MFINKYLRSHMMYELDKNGRELSPEEARKEVFGKACMFFYEAGSNLISCGFADEELEIPRPNPLQANSDGVFPEYFTIPNTTVLIQNSRGKTLLGKDILAGVTEDELPDYSETTNQLTDSVTIRSVGGGFLAKGFRKKMGPMRLKPADLRNGMMPNPKLSKDILVGVTEDERAFFDDVKAGILSAGILEVLE